MISVWTQEYGTAGINPAGIAPQAGKSNAFLTQRRTCMLFILFKDKKRKVMINIDLLLQYVYSLHL